MTTSATPFDGRFGTRTGPAVRLTAGHAVADVFPFVGFNCLRWDVAGEPILFAEPPDTAEPSPTRSGHPILFPFPNRIRDGRFTFDGREYLLPLNDSTKAHAIHGFTPRNPWRVVGSGVDAGSALVTGEIQLTRDLPGSVGLWPADFQFRVTYRLTADSLRVEASVTNPDTKLLPFGIGYHPYFRPPGLGGAVIDTAVLRVESTHLWEAEANLPTGRVVSLPDALDFRAARPIGTTAFDHVFTGMPGGNELRTVATVSAPGASRRLAIRADASFRELVLFTPVHRRAIAIEPYTCATDAANLDGRGTPTGWRVLSPGGRFDAVVEYRLGVNS